MKFVDEFRDAQAVRKYTEAIHNLITQSWTIMEICGGQTHSIVRFGILDLLPSCINLVHGPGCPVCVTPLETIDKALAIAAKPNVIFCSFGDMLRVPGSYSDLQSIRAAGGDVRIVYSPLDCLSIAEKNPEREVVFFAIGFETTAPGNAMLVKRAEQSGLRNLFVLVSHVLVPPAIGAILSSPQNKVQAFLAAGHVCTIMGMQEYDDLAKKYQVPIVVTGFEPLDILQGLYMCIKQLEQGSAHAENQYTRSVLEQGNHPAQQIIAEVFQVLPRKWRGIGEIPQSGWGVREKYQAFDAEYHFRLEAIQVNEPSQCISGQVLRGLKKPYECAAFGAQCTPDHPLGATMVSSEGACTAYYKYRRE